MQLSDIVFHWELWIEFALMLILLMVSALQPNVLIQGLQTIAAPIQRRYTDGGNRLVYLLRTIFQIGILALTALWCMSTQLPNRPLIRFQQYACMMGIVLAVYLLKSGLDRYLNTTFRFAVHAPTYFNHRNTLWQLTCVVLFIYLMLVPYLPMYAQWIMPLVISIAYMGITTGKLINLFGWSVEHLVYIILYILHAEILPMIVMLACAYQLLTYLI